VPEEVEEPHRQRVSFGAFVRKKTLGPKLIHKFASVSNHAVEDFFKAMISMAFRIDIVKNSTYISTFKIIFVKINKDKVHLLESFKSNKVLFIVKHFKKLSQDFLRD
jgi:hypothetical protein